MFTYGTMVMDKFIFKKGWLSEAGPFYLQGGARVLEKRIWREGQWYSKTKVITVVRTAQGKQEPETRYIDVRLKPLFRKW